METEALNATPETNDGRRYWKPRELASEARVEVDTVLRWLRVGEVQGVKFGRIWRIPAAEAERIAAGGFGSTN